MTGHEKIIGEAKINIQIGLNDRMYETGYITERTHDIVHQRLLRKLTNLSACSIISYSEMQKRRDDTHASISDSKRNS